ncbi:hypothetical protein [Chryseobacterium limigenitum]|uniref:Uncharacterized protein n=1 Tax=Chryseobacterium limigenitum TaxID=1612149 RepID=A0A1K2IW44_9FLAO|nr:hypothetical protein [Chryseobacterium limigenitum]SFZ96490.1 hypothetical protein SAMN05216324_12054 [Chryseobacterium limigenitum]
MKKVFSIIFLFIVIFGFSQNQKQAIIKQANDMRKYFMEKNYNAFSNYVYDGVIKMYGNKKKMIEASVDAINKMEKAGYTFKDVTFSDASDIINNKTELQTVVHQKIEMETPKGKILGDYYLVGISKDNGKLWKFIDTVGKNISEMIKYFPNLSSKLNIPKKKITSQ